MKQFIRFLHQGEPVYGVVAPDGVYRLSDAPWKLHRLEERLGDLHTLDLLAPVEPSKIICIGKNYEDHAAETDSVVPDEPLIFLKPPTTVVGPGADIRYPPQSHRVDFEGELAVVIGREIFCPDEVEARRAIFGYVCANDVTARDIQRADGQWTRGKGFDTFCPVGPILHSDVDLGDRWIETRVNGEVKQHSTFGKMAFPPDHIVHYCAQVMTLLPGDLILTGTPAGIAPMEPGDEVEVEIEGFGILKNRILRPQ